MSTRQAAEDVVAAVHCSCTRRATKAEARKIAAIVARKARVGVLMKQNEAAMAQLAAKTSDALVVEVTNEAGVTEERVFQVGKPGGKYVMFRDVDIVANRKLSKTDAAALAQTDAEAAAKASAKAAPAPKKGKPKKTAA